MRVPAVIRLGLVASLGALGLLLPGGAAGERAQTTEIVALTPIAAKLTAPSFLTNAGDGSGRIFIVEKVGRILILEPGDVLLETPFLDITDRMTDGADRQGNERGLLSMAFPPGPGAKGHFYVYYTDPDGTITISRFTIDPSNPDLALAGSEEVLLVVPHPRINHNGGQIAFGPDGLLYIGTGDGGSQEDPDGNGQNPNALLAKLLRMDVEGGPGPYEAEVAALGLRNPWRFSFDGDTLYIGDVGQDRIEEINRVPFPLPDDLNFGWNTMEGSGCFKAETCDMDGLTLPYIEYSSEGDGGHCAVIGGYVYRGRAIPWLIGEYVYADYCSRTIWGISDPPIQAPLFLSSFGLDEAGELYVVTISGTVYRVEPVTEQYPYRVLVPMAARESD